jgi:multidrug resistance efflux pump
MTSKKVVFALAAVAVVGTSAFVYTRTLGPSAEIQVTGTIEARTVRVGSKIGGRVSAVRVAEGESVKPGDVIVEFDERELRASVDQASGRLAYARAQEDKIRRGARPEEVAEAQAAVAQAAAELKLLERGYRVEQVAQAQADVDTAAAEFENARASLARADELMRSDVISRQARDDADARVKMAAGRLKRATERLAELERGHAPEDVSAARARFDRASAALTRLLNGSRTEDIAMAASDVRRAEGELRQAEARYRERQVLSPSAAIVEVLDVRPGDLVGPNASIATLLEPDQVFARMYLPETEMGYVQVGSRAKVQVDSFPNRVFDATVTQINEKAEFLPRSVQSLEDRIHQFFAVKLRIDDPQGVIRPGIAVQARFGRDGSAR